MVQYSKIIVYLFKCTVNTLFTAETSGNALALDTIIYVLRFIIVCIIIIFVVKIYRIVANYIGDKIIAFFKEILKKIASCYSKGVHNNIYIIIFP